MRLSFSNNTKSNKPNVKMSTLVDIGINLTSNQYDKDLDAVVDRAIKSGVTKMIVTGNSVRGSTEAAQIVKKYPNNTYFTAGVHPHDAKTCNANTIKLLTNLLNDPKCVAVGECGLDFDRMYSPREIQETWFEEQVKLAVALNKPLFLHCRGTGSNGSGGSYEPFIAILKKYPAILSKCCVHCFTGTKEQLEMLLAADMYIGITGWICDEKRGKVLQEIVPLIPKDKLMIETDGPFLYPFNVPKSVHTGRRNEPYLLSYVAKKIAECRNEEYEDLVAYTTQNAIKFFGLT